VRGETCAKYFQGHSFTIAKVVGLSFGSIAGCFWQGKLDYSKTDSIFGELLSLQGQLYCCWQLQAQVYDCGISVVVANGCLHQSPKVLFHVMHHFGYNHLEIETFCVNSPIPPELDFIVHAQFDSKEQAVSRSDGSRPSEV
jgi:hypothetical protein